MTKKLLGLMFLLSVVSLSACGIKSEKDRIMDTAVEISCKVIKPQMDVVNNIKEDPEAVDFEAMNKGVQEMEAKMEEIIKKNGFKDKNEFQEVSKKYDKNAEGQENKEFIDALNAATKKECNFDFNDQGLM